MDAPPIPRLVDLVHAFIGVVVEQFKKSIKTPQLFDSSLAIVKATFQNSTKDKMHCSRKILWKNCEKGVSCIAQQSFNPMTLAFLLKFTGYVGVRDVALLNEVRLSGQITESSLPVKYAVHKNLRFTNEVDSFRAKVQYQSFSAERFFSDKLYTIVMCRPHNRTERIFDSLLDFYRTVFETCLLNRPHLRGLCSDSRILKYSSFSWRCIYIQMNNAHC